jgi:hypothetical protein
MAGHSGFAHPAHPLAHQPWYERFRTSLASGAIGLVFLIAAFAGESTSFAQSGAVIFSGGALLDAIKIWRKTRRGEETAPDAWEREVEGRAERVSVWTLTGAMLAIILYDTFTGADRGWPFAVMFLMFAGYLIGRLYWQTRVP